MGKKRTRYFHGYNEYEDELFQQLIELEGHYSLDTVFRDFLQYSAATISNLCDGVHYEERQKDREVLLKKYHGNITLHDCFLSLMKAIQKHQEKGLLRDVLGTIFEAIVLSNERSGQFFTPEHVSQFMAKLTFGEEVQKLQEKPQGILLLHK